MSEYGASHNVIRAAVDMLITAGLVAVHRSEERAYSHQYVLTGLGSYSKRERAP